MQSKLWSTVVLSAAMALTLGTGAAIAQYGPPPGNGYDNYYHERPDHPQIGSRMGWQAGFAQGQSDREHGHSFRPTHTDQYRNVPEAPEGYPHHLFKQEYRDAFVKGYSHGYGR